MCVVFALDVRHLFAAVINSRRVSSHRLYVHGCAVLNPLLVSSYRSIDDKFHSGERSRAKSGSHSPPCERESRSLAGIIARISLEHVANEDPDRGASLSSLETLMSRRSIIIIIIFVNERSGWISRRSSGSYAIAVPRSSFRSPSWK